MSHTVPKSCILIKTHKDKETWSIFMDTQTSVQNKVELNILRLELLKQNDQIEIMAGII